jgi:hypothetical protein
MLNETEFGVREDENDGEGCGTKRCKTYVLYVPTSVLMLKFISKPIQ